MVKLIFIFDIITWTTDKPIEATKIVFFLPIRSIIGPKLKTPKSKPAMTSRVNHFPTHRLAQTSCHSEMIVEVNWAVEKTLSKPLSQGIVGEVVRFLEVKQLKNKILK